MILLAWPQKRRIRWGLLQWIEPDRLQRVGRGERRGFVWDNWGKGRRTFCVSMYQSHGEGSDFLPAYKIDEGDEEKGQKGQDADDD